MTTGYLIDGVDLASIFAAKGATTAAATGYKTNGADLNTQLLALADGQALGRNVGMTVNGTDLSAIFGVTGGTLPINGQTFVALPTQAGGTSTANLYFNCNNSTWSVTGSNSNTSGSIPSGATKVGVTATYLSGSTNSTVTNNLPAYTTLTSTTESLNIHLTSSQSNPINATYSVTIIFQNSAGSTISTTTCRFYMDTAGV